MKKRTFLAMMAIPFLWHSCDESSLNAAKEYFMRAKLDGKWIDFSANFSVDRWEVGRPMLVAGYQEEGFGLPALDIEIWANQPIQIGTYNELNVAILLSRYAAQLNQTYHSRIGRADVDDFMVTITEINTTFVKGTFAGTLTNLDTRQSIKVTEGAFFVPFD
jgi:hypothetical protein